MTAHPPKPPVVIDRDKARGKASRAAARRLAAKSRRGVGIPWFGIAFVIFAATAALMLLMALWSAAELATARNATQRTLAAASLGYFVGGLGVSALLAGVAHKMRGGAAK